MNSARIRFLATIAAAVLLEAAVTETVFAGGNRGFGSGLDVRVVTGDVRLSFSSGFSRMHGGRVLTGRHAGPTRLLTMPRAAPRTFVIIPGRGWNGGYSKQYRYDRGYDRGYKGGYKNYYDKGRFQQYLGEKSRHGNVDDGRRHGAKRGGERGHRGDRGHGGDRDYGGDRGGYRRH